MSKALNTKQSLKKSANILVVDDDVHNRKYYLEVLKKNGYMADEAASGEEAIDFIAENNYELVLSDLQMYKIGGLDVLHVAKEKDPYTQVVIMTGYGSIPTVVKAMQHGAFDYMPKPVNKDAFLMRVQKALEQRRMQLRLEEQQKSLKAHKLMIEKELDLAEKVQASLVPTNFENDRIAVGIEYHPMIGIGGDFCSIHQDNKDLINLNIIDVTGHGIAAALIVNRVYNEINDILKTHPNPQDILSKINSFFYDTFGNMGIYLTMMSIQLDFTKRMLNYAGGAHPAALHYSPAKNTFVNLASQNTIIGFEKSKKGLFTQDTREFRAGDRIIIYTDGVLEAEDEDNNQYGMDGLVTSLKAHINKNVNRACKDVIHDVQQYSNEFYRDDIMLMIVEIR